MVSDFTNLNLFSLLISLCVFSKTAVHFLTVFTNQILNNIEIIMGPLNIMIGYLIHSVYSVPLIRSTSDINLTSLVFKPDTIFTLYSFSGPFSYMSSQKTNKPLNLIPIARINNLKKTLDNLESRFFKQIFTDYCRRNIYA